MGYNASGSGDVRIEKKDFKKIERVLDLKRSFLEELAGVYGFDYQVDSEGSIIELSFEYQKLSDSDEFLKEFSKFVAPGSWFIWIGEDDCRWVEDFGKPESLATVRSGDDVNVAKKQNYVTATFESSANLEVSMKQPLNDEGRKPKEPVLKLKIECPFHGWKQIEWEGTAAELYNLLAKSE